MNLNSQRIFVLLVTTFLIKLHIYASREYAPTELLIKWKDGPQSEAAALGNAKLGSAVVRNFNAVGWQLVQLSEGIAPTEAFRAYREFPEVISIEVNVAFSNLYPSEFQATPAQHPTALS